MTKLEIDEFLSKAHKIKPDPFKLTFDERANRWELESSVHSSPNAMLLHKDYQAIIGMGPKAIPLILKRLMVSRHDWFWALDHLAPGEVQIHEPSSFGEFREAWLKWGREKGYVR